MKNKNNGAGKPAPKSSTERGQIRTAKDNAWAQAVSKGKYKTLRSLMGAIHAGKYALVELAHRTAQPTTIARDLRDVARLKDKIKEMETK